MLLPVSKSSKSVGLVHAWDGLDALDVVTGVVATSIVLRAERGDDRKAPA